MKKVEVTRQQVAEFSTLLSMRILYGIGDTMRAYHRDMDEMPQELRELLEYLLRDGDAPLSQHFINKNIASAIEEAIREDIYLHCGFEHHNIELVGEEPDDVFYDLEQKGKMA